MPGRAASATVDATSPARVVDAVDASASAGEPSATPEVVLEPGHKAGDFLIEAVLGRGTFGTVYRGAHAVIGRRAAIKVLRDDRADERRVASFLEEARLVARLRHPNIVDVLTYGRLEDGRHFHVMDLIEGPTLTEFLREHGALDLREALPILRGIASALDAVHVSGIAHRDLKPANVVLERRQGELVPKLIDFGIAELIEEGASEASAARRGPVGTPRYMAPEQCRGQAIDARADVYAFGLLTYEMLTGQPPFSGDDSVELMLKHTSREPASPSSVRPSLPRALDAIVLGMLAKDPEQRPSELGPVVSAIEVLASGPNKASGRWARLGVAALVVGAGASVVVMSQRGEQASAAPGANSASTAASGVAEPGAGAQPRSPSEAIATADVSAPDSARAPLVSASASGPPRVGSPAKSGRRSASAEPDLEAPENPFGGR